MNQYVGNRRTMVREAPQSVFAPPTDPDEKKDDSPFPSLKRRPAEERADEIVDALKDAILNPGRGEGKTGMYLGDWTKIARRDIARAIREAETIAAFRELMSANRIGGLCLRVGFLLLASVASFAAFWYGCVFIWRTYGPIWGLGATISALGLAIAFVAAGLAYGGENREAVKEKAVERTRGR